jgi:hypothetical protein
MLRKNLVLSGVVAAVVGLAGTANATLFTANDGSAQVDITTTPNGANTDLHIVLTNLTTADNTTSAGNLLTGLELIPVDISTFSLTAQTGAQEFTFATETTGTVSSGSFDPSWALVTSPAHSLYFDGFGSGGKPIIGGPATGGTNYNNANTSLTSGPHGPYIYETADFTVEAPGAFDVSSIATVNFLFNTDGSIVVPGGPNTGSGVPEPASLGVLGVGAIGLLLRRRR